MTGGGNYFGRQPVQKDVGRSVPMKPDRKQRRVRLAALAAFTLSLWGCASTPPPSPVPCSRVALEPAPPWTASAAWNAEEDELVLVDPGSRGLAAYGRDGKRRREISLGGVELDYGQPMRFERAEDGYVLIGKRQVLRLDEDLALKGRQRPFAPLEAQGVIDDGSLNDAVLHAGALYGYADFIDAKENPQSDPKATGRWRRGFVRLDAADGELEMLHELPLEGSDGEYAAYYLYDRRPYVARSGGKVYVLRFTDPWTVHRVTHRGLHQIASGDAGDAARARALQAWNGKLYVLTSRAVADEEEGKAADEHATPAKPAGGQRASLEMLQVLPVMALGRRQWTLHEIEPRGGAERRLTLPTLAERIRLVPGRSFWTAIEESTSPNLGGERDSTTFLFLPAAEIAAGAFSCSG
jgi:hypothetical protein